MCDNPQDNRQRPEWLFRNLNNAHRLATDALFHRMGIIDLGQPMMLFILSEGAVSTQKELAEMMGLSPSTVTISLKSMERLGYVRKTSDPNDMRRKRIEITEFGLETAEKCRHVFHVIDNVMYKDFTPEEKDLISQLYIRMTNNLIMLADSPEYNQGRFPSVPDNKKIHR